MMGDNHMQLQRDPEQPPSYAQAHDPQTIQLPSVPQHELPQIHQERKLPSLSSILQDQPLPRRSVEEEHIPTPWITSNPLAAYYQPSHNSPRIRSNMGMDSPSTMDIDAATPDSRRAGSVLSIDDPDVRIAAEALGDLRAADFHSPSPQHSSLPYSRQQPEPLLSLLTTSHPIIGTAIGGSLSAYSASKNYSPRFKSGAEYVERRITPVVNTVGTINRVTGVEGGVRWFLESRRPSHHNPSDLEQGSSSNKRRKVTGNEMDIDSPGSMAVDAYPVQRDPQLQHRERRTSHGSTVESLPAYDEHRSPIYEADEQALISTQDSPLTPGGSTWQSRLMLSTSGLSIAMSEESLRSLKYCLGWLRWANEHIGKVISALRSVLEGYDSRLNHGGERITNGRENSGQLVVHNSNAENHQALNAKIAELKSDVLKTLKDVVDVVSKYAGGALPENARVLVRRHLTSLPQRFQRANKGEQSPSSNGGNGAVGVPKGAEGEAREGARRVMLLAKEGLDMMAQVSGVLDGTIVSAEEWCERLGRKKRGETMEDIVGADQEQFQRRQEETRRPVAGLSGDIKMG